MSTPEIHSSTKLLWLGFRKNKIALFALCFLLLLSFLGIYAPFFASSKPIVLLYRENIYFPLFRYLFYPGFFTKPIDLFFNVFMCLMPLFLLGWLLKRTFFKNSNYVGTLLLFLTLQLSLTYMFSTGIVKDPERNLAFVEEKEKTEQKLPDFGYDLQHLKTYEKLNLILSHKQKHAQRERLAQAAEKYREKTGQLLPILYELDMRRNTEEREKLENLLFVHEKEYQDAVEAFPTLLKAYLPFSHALTLASFAYKQAIEEEKGQHLQNFEKASRAEERARRPIDEAEKLFRKYRYAKARLNYLDKKQKWLEQESREVRVLLAPLLRSFHWEEDAGGGQTKWKT